MFQYANSLIANFANQVLSCFTNWLILLHARKTLVSRLNDDDLRASITENQDKIDKFFETLPETIEKIKTQEEKEEEIAEWKAAYEREEKAKLRAKLEKELQNSNS